jgi:hypothetical protein
MPVRTTNLKEPEMLLIGEILVVSDLQVLTSEVCTSLLIPAVTHANTNFMIFYVPSVFMLLANVKVTCDDVLTFIPFRSMGLQCRRS